MSREPAPRVRGHRRLLVSRRWPAAVVAAVILLSACGQDGEPTTTASTIARSTVTEPAGAGAPAAPAPSTVTVAIQTFQFQPDPLTVSAGTTVVFINNDNIDHTVTAGTRENPTPEIFDGLLPDKDATFELTLVEPGTYDYFCRIHPGPGMTGQIIVTP